ncbi:hypothetical protein INR49_007155, partial [Caranx melampygus]
MSKKRSKTPEAQNLRAVIDHQLAAVADHIFWLLKERGQAELEQLRELITERITAAVEEIFTAFRATRTTDRDAEGPEDSPRSRPGADRTELCLSVGVRSLSGEKHLKPDVRLKEPLPGTSSRPETASEPDHPPASPEDPACEEEEDDEEATAHCCRVCGKSFDRKGFLMKHVEKHSKDTECLCGLCVQQRSLFALGASLSSARTVVDAELGVSVYLPAASLCSLGAEIAQKRRKMCAVQLLRVSVHERISAAAEDFLLQVEKGEEAAEVPALRALLTERLTAAAEEIVGLFEETVAEYEDRVERSEREICRQRRLLDAVLKPEVKLHRA